MTSIRIEIAMDQRLGIRFNQETKERDRERIVNLTFFKLAKGKTLHRAEVYVGMMLGRDNPGNDETWRL